jgi:2-C-methyl-D-erythritol 4-phosphate cytidylyltransferase
MNGRISLIVPAAGEGTRMKANVRKPFLTLAGRPILHHTLDRFRGFAGISQVILAVNGVDFANNEAFLAEMSCFGVTDVVKGGATRTESVSNALAALAPGVEIVLIHDAVRPFVSLDVIHGVIEAAAKHGAAIAAAPVKDTVKRVSGGLITGTVPRDSLYLAQTPQGFRREVIVAAYRRAAPAEFTDDAAVVEAAGGQVAVVPSTYDNFKITTPDDLALAKAVFAARE